MTKASCRQLVPLLLLLGCTRAMSDEVSKTTAPPTFSQSASDVVLRVTWGDARTLRKWSRSFFGNGSVEAADFGFDGKAVAPPRVWLIDTERLASELATAVEAGLTTSSQQQMLDHIRDTGRSAEFAEDEVSLTVELRFSEGADAPGEPTEVVRVFRTRDPLGMARRFPEIPELAALARLFEFARNTQPM